MAKTTFVHGTQITPELLNAINNPTYSADPQFDGQIPYPDKAGIGLDVVEEDVEQLNTDLTAEAEARVAGDAAEAEARHEADVIFDSRISALESVLTQVRIPDTGPNALKVYGSTANASSADLDITFGALYQVSAKGATGVLSLYASFALVTGYLVSSSREVSFYLNNPEFGALVEAHLSPFDGPLPLPRRIPVRVSLGQGGTKNYSLRVNPLGDTPFFALCDESDAPLTYSSLLAAAGISVIIRFDINYDTPIALPG